MKRAIPTILPVSLCLVLLVACASQATPPTLQQAQPTGLDINQPTPTPKINPLKEDTPQAQPPLDLSQPPPPPEILPMPGGDKPLQTNMAVPLVTQPYSLTLSVQNQSLTANAIFYPASRPGSAAILILPGEKDVKSIWQSFAQAAQVKGLATLVIDLPASYPSQPNSTTLDALAEAGLKWLLSSQGGNAPGAAVVGSSSGANLAMRLAATQLQVKALVLLSPELSNKDLPVTEALTHLSSRPVYIVSAGANLVLPGGLSGAKVQQLPGETKGAELLQEQDGLTLQILNWVNDNLGQ